MIQVGMSRAKCGDSSMLRLFLSYLIGQPTQYVKQDVSGGLTLYVVNWDDANGENGTD